MNTSPKEFLESTYNDAVLSVSKNTFAKLPGQLKEWIDLIIQHSEKSKAVNTVFITSLVYKILNPEQDIRYHQSGLEGGYSGRTFDTTYITPFLREHNFPSMAESGWLTRSLEQKSPYTLDYKGAIRPEKLKTAFLSSLDAIQNGANVNSLLDYVMQQLIVEREKNAISLALPGSLPISGIIKLVDSHFHSSYKSTGASRLATLSIYAIYESLFSDGIKRFNDKKLLPLESHTSADTRSGRLGDIDIVNSDGTAFEAVEVKFDIPISHEILQIAKSKILPSTVNRYYLLSTKEPLESDYVKISDDIRQIKNTHGCQVVVNGILQTLKYYLRLLDDPSIFLRKYTELVQNDPAIKYEHKECWNTLVSNLE